MGFMIINWISLIWPFDIIFSLCILQFIGLQMAECNLLVFFGIRLSTFVIWFYNINRRSQVIRLLMIAQKH